MKICIEPSKPLTKQPPELIPGHIYEYLHQDGSWYYIYGKLHGVGGVFTKLDTGDVWKEAGSQASIDMLTDVTDQFCLKKE